MNKKLVKNEKGLTLVELLAVIVILAIVAAIAVPAIGNIIQNSRDKAVLTEALNIISGAKIAKMDGKCDGGEGDQDQACDNETLTDYVEGVTGGEDVEYTANYDGDNWKINFTKFDGLQDGKNFKEIKNGVTETTLKASLDKGSYVAP